MSKSNPHERLVELVTERQLAEPTPEDVRELEGLLQSSSARRLYIELINLQGHLETLLTRRAVEDVVHQLDTDKIFAMLRQAEDAAPDVVAPWQASELHIGPASKDQSALTLSHTASAVSYLIRQQVKRHRVFLGGIAALLVIGAVLALSFLGGPDDPIHPDPLAVAPQDAPASVATLTATHNAQWAERALARGSKLQAGDRLTLTAGFAEITTNRGAIAILEAPCTVELLDNNALRLHTGKLVGVCDTESSKGFLVRTPYMDVTDLGTQFGVDTSRFNASVVNVFEGEVSVASSTINRAQQSILLKAHEAVAIDSAGKAWRVEPDPLSFVQADEFDAIVRADTSASHRWYAYTTELKRDPDLLALYVFDGDDDRAVASNTATPRAGKYHAQLGDGRDHTSPSRSADRFGRTDSALAFDRQKMQALYVPDWHQAGPLNALTVSCWFKLDQDIGQWPLLVTHWHDNLANKISDAFHLGVSHAIDLPSSTGKGVGLQAHVSHTGQRDSKAGWYVKHETHSGTVTTPDDGWVHVVLTIQCGGGPIRLYKNGMEIDTNGATYPPAHLPNPKHPLVIGGKSTYRGVGREDITDYAFSGYFQGEIDDVALIGRALTKDEVSGMYRAGVAEPH